MRRYRIHVEGDSGIAHVRLVKSVWAISTYITIDPEQMLIIRHKDFGGSE